MFNAYAQMLERSFNQYINCTKILQNSINTAVEFNLKASKNYMEWLTERRSHLMKIYLSPTMVLRPKIETKTEVKKEEAKVQASETTKVPETTTAPKRKTKNALYQV